MAVAENHVVRDAYMRGFNAGYEECLQQLRQGHHYEGLGEHKRTMSPEVRQRISESMKKSHEERKKKIPKSAKSTTVKP